MTLLIVSALLPCVSVFLALRRIIDRDVAGAVLAIGLSVGLGTGLAATLLLAWRFVAPAPWISVFPFVDAMVWVTLAAAATRIAGQRANARQPRWSREELALAGALTAVLVLSLSYFVLHVFRVPHGEWDAWAIWNLKARFLASGGEHWRDLFSTVLPHGRYPLLVSASVARLWIWDGSEPAVAGAFVAAAFTYAIPLVVVGSVARVRGWTSGLWAGLIVMAAAPLTTYGAFQVADVPFAYFVLATLALLALGTSFDKLTVATCAGAAVGMAGLVKDEGMPYMIAMTVGFFVYQWRRPAATGRVRFAQVSAFLAGALPFWCVLAAIGAASASTGGLAAAFTDAQVMNKLGDVARHAQILRSLLGTASGWAAVCGVGAVPVLLLALVLGWQPRRDIRAAAAFATAALAAMVASYYAAYLVTPYDLTWHIATSLDRIATHLWPTAVWAVCLVVTFDRPGPSAIPPLGS